jgi:hypothetical protein
MKSLKTLWKVAADELAAICCTSATLDVKTVERRTENEGLSFLTITLPGFAKSFERSLDAGQVDPIDFVGFEMSRRGRGPLPLFLGGFLGQVFSTIDGRLLDAPSIDCIFAVRQLTMMFGKILLPCSDVRERGAMRQYVECEQEVQAAAKYGPDELYLEFERVAAVLWSDVFSEVENRLYQGPLIPKHGPGATADRLRGNAKFDQREWTVRLEGAGFAFGEYVLPNWRFASELDHVDFLEPGSERPVRVITVPKTLKTPRVIAVEPTCMQYTQQALAAELVFACEQRRVGNNSRQNAVHGQVGFSDQMPNRLLAEKGSREGTLATLDLSEASDRVSIRHVKHLFARWPLLYEAVMATRSSKAEVPGYGVIPLTKYASMGSALTFPIEAMVFLTAVYVGIEHALNRHITRRDVINLAGSVRVYGDDIIIPVDYVRNVIRVLESIGFKVNTGKSFWNGKFRESCGGDYYDGQDVTPVRVRRVFPSSRFDAEEVLSLVSLRNHLYFNGLWDTARHLDQVIEGVLPHFPVVEPTSPALGRHSFLPYEAERMCDRLHRPLVKGYVVRDVPPDSSVSGIGALLKFFLKPGDEPYADREHLTRQGRSRAVSIKPAWTTPY